MSTHRVLIVQHTPRGGPRRLADWLAEDGIAAEVATPYDGSALPSPMDHDGLVVLGGGYMPDDDDRAPWFPATRRLVRSAVEDDIPYLGICLGGQMLAQVTGGTVIADAGTPEKGSTAITIRDAARDDALFHSLPEQVTAIENHVDVITALPPEAAWLAASDVCPYQAFRVGSRAWGVQFHPEVGPDRILEWDEDRLRRLGFDRHRLHEQAVADEPAATPVWREVSRRFADAVRDTSSPGG